MTKQREKITMKLIPAFFSVVCCLFLNCSVFAAEPIQHKMLLLDESRFQMLSVDQANPENNWKIDLGGHCRDIQIVGNNRVLVALMSAGGFREYDLKTRKIVREVTNNPRYSSAMTAVRFPDGKTVLGCDQDCVRIFVFDPQGREINNFTFPDFHVIRLMRRTSRDTLLFGTNVDKTMEIDLQGNFLREVQVPDAKHNYQTIEMPSGHWLHACGYAGFLAETDADGKIVKKWGGTPVPDGLLYYFMSQFQMLRNGNIVVATWTGHGANDSEKGQQLVEFDTDGNVVWTWYDAKMAGSIHGVIVLDNLDLEKFYDDADGILEN